MRQEGLQGYRSQTTGRTIVMSCLRWSVSDKEGVIPDRRARSLSALCDPPTDKEVGAWPGGAGPIRVSLATDFSLAARP